MTIEYGAMNPDRTVRIVDVSEWLATFDNEDRIVARTNIAGMTVSTVFLGINHAYFTDHEPMWFETMIFDNQHDSQFRYQERCATYEQAVQEHHRAITVVITHHSAARLRHRLAETLTSEEMN